MITPIATGAGLVAVAGAAFGAGSFLRGRREARQDMKDEHQQVMESMEQIKDALSKLAEGHKQMHESMDEQDHSDCPVKDIKLEEE